MDPLEPTSTRSRYCETCNQLANDLNKIRDLDKAQRKAFSTSVASSCGSSVPQPKDVHLSKEVDLLKEKLKKQTEEAKQELQRYNANEELIRKQRDMVCAEYDRVLKRCEALEVELSKRRQAELSRQQQQAVGFDVVGVNEANIPTNDALRAELRKAYGRIKILETELAAEKNGDVAGDISANSHLTILRSNMQQLEQCKRNCERRLADQEETLRQLESDIALLMDEKADLKRRCAHLERLSNEAVAENTKHLKAIHELRFELTCAQEKESASTRAHLAEIETYQRLLKQKEAERAMFIEQLREDVQPVHLDDSSPIIEQEGSLERQRLVEVKEQLENLTAENEKLTSEMDRLKSDLSSTGTQLRCKQEELEREIAQNNVLQQQLADAQKLISEKDAQLLEANNQLKVLDLNLVKLETELANANDHLEAERESNATLKNAVDEFEELLREKTDELVASNIESQRANSDAQRHKETVFDLETKLALQGRELRNTRAKLLDLKTKIKRLEREAAELSPRSAPSTGRTTASSMLTKSPSASPSL
ncbi:hypothetical protein Tcan_18087 [Toxocara canis]|uniref:Uncharacterized protein n=1 Tax=Toxocara canis TaxID=6265 RepID=A0A0B2UT67_TOXCA|nr:hypothetical protein Tcan_18087 [Toxocara canis]